MKRKYFHPVYNDQYSIHAKLVKSSFLKDVTEGSKKEKSAVVKFWRAKFYFPLITYYTEPKDSSGKHFLIAIAILFQRPYRSI